MRVLVTGATGFVAGPVLEALTAAGHEVVSATRTSRPDLQDTGKTARSIAVGDMSRSTDWSLALEGCEAIVHLAGRAHVMKDDPRQSERLYEEGNVGVLDGLARAAVRASVRRFVFVSSIKVNGEETAKGQPFTSRDAPAPLDAYGRTKLEAELRLMKIAAEARGSGRAMEWVVVRPPLIYGPGVRGNVARLIRLVEAGAPLPFASIENERDLISVGALADLLASVTTHPNAANRTFLARDGSPISTPDLIRGLARAAGKRPRLFPCPTGLLRAAGRVLGLRDELSRLTGDLRIDDEETRQLLGWSYPVDRDQAFKRMVEGQKAQHGSQR